MNENGTLLLVDDDWSVQIALSGLLQSVGYHVVSAGDGADAIALFRSRPIDVVLLDLNLPMKSGWEVFERLTTLDPPVPVIIVTGRPDQAQMAEAAGTAALMEKPLDIPTLLKLLCTVMAEAPELRLARLAGHRP